MKKKKKSGYRSDETGTKVYNKQAPRNSGIKTINKATCSSCGNTCEVPFKPNGKKPIYCNDCYRKDNSSFPDKKSHGFNKYTDSNHQKFRSENRAPSITLEQINKKLDLVLEQLNSLQSK